MEELSLKKLFRTSEPSRDNFLSRVFGMFAEEPVRIWCRSGDSQFRDLGRPKIKRPGETRGSTIDFALQSKATGKVYVAELKCELAFANYGYLVLTSVAQVNRHIYEKKEAFLRFIDCAKNPQRYVIHVGGKLVETAGSVLVWGSVSEQGRQAVMADYGFAGVLSVEEIIRDLLQKNNHEYKVFVEQRRKWCDELFSALFGG
jgi:hypothetical protein